MNPNLCRVVLRPRGPLEVFDLTFRLMRERWQPLAALAVVTVGPPWFLGSLLCWWFEGSPWLLLYPFLLAPVLQAPFTTLTGRLLFSEDVSAMSALWESLRQTPRLVGPWLVGALGWVAGVATCGYGLIPVQAAILYLPETAVLERVGLQRGVRRSLRLAGGQVGVALVGALARIALTVWGAVVAELGGQAVVGFVLQLGEPFGAAVDGVVTPYLLLGLLASQPLHSVYRLLLYVDVRTRMEGWDLQVGLRAAGMGA